MRKTYIISLALLLVLAAGLAKRQADTAPEFYPLASAISWVGGTGRAIPQELTGAGIRPPGLVKIGRSYVPRTPPIIILQDSIIVQAYKSAVGRNLDGGNLPLVCWFLNFFGVIPWVILLFSAVRRLASLWSQENGTSPLWAAWAALSGSLAFGWMGVVSLYLPAAALGLQAAAYVLEYRRNRKPGSLAVAGICTGLSGAWHPSGWIWIIWALLYLFINQPDGEKTRPPAKPLLIFGGPAAVGIVIALAGNVLFFGTPLPVQLIDLQPVDLDSGGIIRLLWHDLAGWNGLVWLAPAIVSGIVMMLRGIGKHSDEPGLSTEMFLLGLAVVALFVWGITEDARTIGEIERMSPEFSVIPMELTDGQFSMVQIGQASGGPDESRAFYERIIERTDVFLWSGGRSPGLPVFMPAAILLVLLGWCRAGTSRFLRNLNWIGIRWAALLGLIMSQAPYGAVSDAYLYAGYIASAGHVPIIESILAVSVRLSGLWPSGVVSF